jgi:hypothetical protein
MQDRKTKEHKMRSEGQGKNLTEQGDEDNEQFNYPESYREGDGGVSVVNRLEVGQEKCVSNSGETVRGTK